MILNPYYYKELKMLYKFNFLKLMLFLLIIKFSDVYAKNEQVYIVGVENIDYMPYYTVNSSGEYGGYSRDLLDLFCKKNNIKFKYQPMSVLRLFREFLDGNVDFKFPDDKLWQSQLKADKNIFYSNNAVEYIDGLIIRNEFKDKKIEDLKIIGTIRGFEVGVYKEKNIKILESSSIAELLNKLDKKEIDGVYFNINVALNFINKNNFFKNKFAFKKEFPYTRDYYKLSSIKHKDIILKFNQFLIKSNTEINKLKKKYNIFI